MAHDLLPAVRAQLQLLQLLGAVSADTAIGRHKCTNGLGDLKPTLLAHVLVKQGYAASRHVAGWNGVPPHTAYWLTDKGQAWAQHLNQAED